MKHFVWRVVMLAGLVLVFNGGHEEAKAASGGNSNNQETRGLVAP